MMPIVATLALLALSVPTMAQDVSLQPADPAQDLPERLQFRFNEQAGEPLVGFIDLAKVLLQRPMQYDPAEVADTRIFIVGAITVDRDELFPFFQAVLKAYDFVVTESGPRGGTFLKIRKLNVERDPSGSRRRRLMGNTAPIVPRDELESYADDPATVITTAIALEHVEPEVALAAVNRWFDLSVEGLRSVDDRRSLVVTGFGSTVWTAHRILESWDRAPVTGSHRIVRIDADRVRDREILAIVAGLDEVLERHDDEHRPRLHFEPRAQALFVAGSAEVVAATEAWLARLGVGQVGSLAGRPESTR